jgi:hypothetical protein
MPRPFRTCSALILLLSASLASHASAQKLPREIRIEVRDRNGNPVPDAQITFFLSRDSARTDSAGNAKVTVIADSVIEIAARKLGFEQRTARFRLSSAIGFTVRVPMGDATQKLDEVEVRENYEDPWRKGFELRKHRGGGQFRDMTNFASGMPNTISEWFSGLPGVRTGGGAGGRDINIPRCRRLGVWIDGQHATLPGADARFAINTVPAQDIGAFELYTSSTPAQFTGQGEDCSLLIWTRLR